MQWSIGTKIGAGFVVAVLLLIVTNVLAHRIMRGLIQTAEREERSLTILRELEEILSDMRAAETGEREFIITGDRASLEPYTTAALDIGDELNDLRTLEAGEPSELQRLTLLAGVIHRRFAQLQEAIAVRKTADLGTAVRFFQEHGGTSSMDDIQQIIGQRTSKEEATHTRLDAATEEVVQTSFGAIDYGSLSALLVLAVVGVLTTRSVMGAFNHTAERLERAEPAATAHPRPPGRLWSSRR